MNTVAEIAPASKCSPSILPQRFSPRSSPPPRSSVVVPFPERSPSSGNFHSLAELRARTATSPDDLVPDFLGRGELVVLYGKEGSGKSYLALDLALSLATGTDWLGHVITQTPVLYVLADKPDPRKFLDRADAWEAAHQSTVEQFRARVGTITLTRPEGWQMVVNEVRALDRPVIVLDTLSALLGGGDENGPTDMGAFVQACNRLIEAGATVIVLHHPGKDGKLRGHTSLPAAANRIYKQKKDGDRLTLTREKNSDGKQDGRWSFRLVPVEEADGPCLVEYVGTASPDAGQSASTLRGAKRAALAALDTPLRTAAWQRASGINPRTFERIPRQLESDGYVVQADDGTWSRTNPE